MKHNYSYRFDEIQEILNTLPLVTERLYSNLSRIKTYSTYHTIPHTRRELAIKTYVSKTQVYRAIPILVKCGLITEIAVLSEKRPCKYIYYLKMEHQLLMENKEEIDGALLNRIRTEELTKAESLHSDNGNTENEVTRTRNYLKQLGA